MQRILAELYAETLEGLVVDGTPVDEFSGRFDLKCMFTLRCDDGALFRVPGWAVHITELEAG